MRAEATRRPLADRMICPACRGNLQSEPEHLVCTVCKHDYVITDGIAILVADGHGGGHDEIDHLVGQSVEGHNRAQAAFFDEATAAEFEVTRPHGAPALYTWLLAEKLRRATRGIEAMVSGREVLVVCGGSGMDAEFFARMGGRVISSDISLGAARRTVERAHRFGADITAIVADAERLPFANRSMEVVAVHDGLHHLESPERALDEMARVAAGAVSVSEPANAAVTAIAVRLGLALEREEAGNRVARLDPAAVAAQLERAGFRTLLADRYLMYYHHVPGRFMGLLSGSRVLPLVQASLGLLNRVVGRLGNKMVVVAVRSGDAG